MVKIFMMSAKLATPALFKIEIDFITISNHIADVAMWPKFGKYCISMRKVQYYKDLTRKIIFWRMVLVQVQYFRTDTNVWPWNFTAMLQKDWN